MVQLAHGEPPCRHWVGTTGATASGDDGRGRAQTPPGRDVDAVAGRQGKGERGPVRRRPAHTACHYIRHGRPISLFRQAAAPVTALVKGGSICYNIVKTAT